mmetsp:Transcript_47208/g.110385  ORF Transcript_47208/g.110385 Transcript_47208/m.110385 type:complete len:463 (-) Transcript_47208:9-1397(-)
MAMLPGNVVFKPKPEELEKAKTLLGELRDGKWMDQKSAASELLPLFFFSDFEFDDLMAIAQLWQWKLEMMGKKSSQARPVIVFCADFETKDGATIFEKKLLMARLMAGIEPCRDFQIVCSERNTYYDKTVHPLATKLFERFDTSLDIAAKELAQVADMGLGMDFYMIAPGRGHLGALLERVEEKYPEAFEKLCSRTHTVMYTGSFNTQNCKPKDFKYIVKLGASEPIVDISKFIFFGRELAHPITASANSFTQESLTESLSLIKYLLWSLSEASPLLAAAVVLFVEEFQGNLIVPENKSLFRGSTLTPEEQARFDEIAKLSSKPNQFQMYAKSLFEDEEIFAKVPNYKKSTVKAFAEGSCDAPLCDEACFLYEWLQKNHKGSLLCASPSEGGQWWVHPDTGFSGVVTDTSPAPEKATCFSVNAFQPSIKEPRDEELLQKMRDTLAEYVLRHISLVEGVKMPE